MKLDCSEILKIIPHRYPFVLLDRVEELEPGKSAVGIKNVTINEPYFTGHFPTEPIVPGVLLIESLAQLAAVMYCSEFIPTKTDKSNKLVVDESNISIEDISSKVGYLVEIKNVKFKKTVKPGDKLTLRCFKKSSFGLMSQVKVDAYVDTDCILEGTITVSQRA